MRECDNVALTSSANVVRVTTMICSAKLNFNAARSDGPSHMVRDKTDVWKDLASQFSALRLTKSSDRASCVLGSR